MRSPTIFEYAELALRHLIQMLYDGRIDMINDLVSQYLNGDSASCKVSTNHGVEQRLNILST